MVSKKEWKLVSVIGLVVMVLTFSPVIFGYLVTPPGKVFLFLPTINGGDFPVYYSQIEQVKAGNFLFRDLFGSEPQPVSVFNPFWLSLGILAAIFSLPSFLVFHVARLVLIPLFLISAYYLVVFFFGEAIRKENLFYYLALV